MNFIKKRDTFIRWFTLGLAFRLLLMPFFTHLDLLTDYWVAHLTAFEHRLPSEIRGGIYCFSILHYMHTFFLKTLAIIAPYLKTIWFQPWGLPDSEGMTTIANWMNFVGSRQIFLTLFLLKVPYLLFDMAACFILLSFFETEKSQTSFLKFWMFNPISLFVIYIFSRYEIIPMFFIILSILYLKKNKCALGAIFLGIALVMKLYALLFVPFYVLSTGPKWPHRARNLLWVLAPGILMIAVAVLSGKAAEFSNFTTLPHNDYILGLNVLIHPNNELNYVDRIYIVPVVFMLLLLIAEREKPGWQTYVDHIFIFLNLFFAFSFFHPQYFFWIVPFWALKIQSHKSFLPLFLLQVMLVGVYSFHWVRPLSVYLAAPLAPEFFSSLPSPFEIINIFYPGDKFINLTRSIFTGVSLWIIYRVWYFRKEGNQDV
ncbi:hypothetical protein ACFL27_21860 [candidate division CSSED10-310 bacterium]|uniref:DUF2029 domain-containing protein n=1 Tax=candidate division CSSED10-310 bacterium TaxID=2855610 RepID=A0ABV6Z3F1_UNCC1